MKKVLLFILLHISYLVCSQTSYLNKFWVITDKYETAESEFSDDGALNTFFNAQSIVHFRQVFPTSQTILLQNLFEIETNGDVDSLINLMNTTFGSDFYSYRKLEDTQNIALYDPSDYLWASQKNGWLWFLTKIEADKAWDLTLGDPNVVTAIIDTDFDVTHPDLSTEIIKHYDPYSSLDPDPNVNKGINPNTGNPYHPYGCLTPGIIAHGTHGWPCFCSL